MYVFVQIFLFAFCPWEGFGSSEQLLSAGAGCLQLWELKASSALTASELPSCERHPAFCCPSGGGPGGTAGPGGHGWGEPGWPCPAGAARRARPAGAVCGAAGCLFDCCWPGTLFVAARSKLPSLSNLCV